MGGSPRIVSLLPSATEMVFALGLGESLVGVTHECDYPPQARAKPAVVRNVLPIETMSDREIDQAVSERLRQGLSLYALDAALIDRLAPDLIITQSLCDVCAPSGNEIARLLERLSRAPELLWMSPSDLGGIARNILELGSAAGREERARSLVAEGRRRLDALAKATRDLPRRRVFCMEWLDPVYCSGHWIPEMVRIAGGVDGLGRAGADSVRLDWQAVLDFAPEVLILMPCGDRLDAALGRAEALWSLPGFADLPAARRGSVFAVDANAYFARPGPRVVDGAELLAHLLHPHRFDWPGPSDAYRRLGMLPPSGPVALGRRCR